MLEGEYLELVDDLKKKFEEKEKEVALYKEETDELKKMFYSCYGYIRVLDYVADENECSSELKGLIGVLRSYLSDQRDILGL